MKSGNTNTKSSNNKYSNVTNNHNNPSKKSNHSNLYEVDKSGLSRRENNISNTFTTHNMSSNNNHSYLNPTQRDHRSNLKDNENSAIKTGINNTHNSNKKNIKSNGLGNSLFKGQKFIDFQEPFNDTIRPVRDKGSTCTGTIDTNALNSPLRNSGEINWNEDLLYGTENVKLEQIEIRDNIDIEYLERGVSDNLENLDENNFEINYEDEENNNNNNIQYNPIQVENDNSQFSNYSHSHSNNNLKEISSNSLINNNNPNISPITLPKDHLLKNSKYFNNINVPNANANSTQHIHNNIDYNLISTSATKNNQTVNTKTTPSNNNNNLINQNSYSPINPKSIGLSNPGSNENISNLDFINTLMRLKSGLKLDTSTTYIPNNNINYSNNLPNNDESKSYIKEILDMCSGSESKMNEISNLESRNFDDVGENNSMISGNNTNFNSFLNIGIGFDNIKGSNYNQNFYQNNFFNGQGQGSINNFTNRQTGSGNKNTINSNNPNNQIQNNNNNFNQHPRSLKVDDLIEITNKRKNMVSSGTSNDAYLRRRHLETLSKLEKMKKEKEDREIGDQKFHPVINRKSKEMAHRMSRQNIGSLSKSSDKLPHVNTVDTNVMQNNNFDNTPNKKFSPTPYAYEDPRSTNHYYNFPADNDLILSEREYRKDITGNSFEKESKTDRVLPAKEISKSENKMVNISHIRQDTKDILSQIDDILLEENHNKELYKNNENIYLEKIRNTNEIREAYRRDKNRRNSSGSILYEKKDRLKSDIMGGNLDIEQSNRERAFSPSPYQLIRNNKFEGYYHPEINYDIDNTGNQFTSSNNNLINSPEKNIQKNAKNFNAKNNLISQGNNNNLNTLTPNFNHLLSTAPLTNMGMTNQIPNQVSNQVPNQGGFKLEINNKIYLPQGANYNNYNPHVTPQPNTADKIEKVRPNLDYNSPVHKNFISTSSDLVNYGTKPHKSTNEIRILDNIKIHNTENTIPNTITTVGNYETNKNFVFSYDSNKILQEKNLLSKDPKENLIPGGANTAINTFNYNLPSPIAYNAHNQILDTIPTQQGDEVLLTLTNPSVAVDHVEINLFDTSINNNSARAMGKNNQNLKISNQGPIAISGNNMNMTTGESRSFVQLFPVFDKPDFKMQNDQNNQEDFIINENSCNRPLNTSTNAFANAKETGFKYNYNTHLNSDLISVNNSNNNSECNEYGHDIHQKQNESANINLFSNNCNTNSNSNLHNQMPTHRQSNTSSSNNENISLNFSKFTNFVGMSEQYSKRTFSSNTKAQNTSNSNRILNNNYYNNIFSKKSEKAGNQVSPNIPTGNNNVNDISNRNMINSYLDNDNQSSHNLLNKNPSNKSIGKSSVNIKDKDSTGNLNNIINYNNNVPSNSHTNIQNNIGNKIHSIINENLISEDDIVTRSSVDRASFMEKVDRGSFVEKIERVDKVDRRSFVEKIDRGSFIEKGDGNAINNRNYNTINPNTLSDNNDLKKINYFEKDNLLVSTSSIASGNNKNIKAGKDKVIPNPDDNIVGTDTRREIKIENQDIAKLEKDERLVPEDLRVEEVELNLHDTETNDNEAPNSKTSNENIIPSISAVIDEILKPKYLFNKKVNYEKPKTNPFIKKNETAGVIGKDEKNSRSLSKNRIEKNSTGNTERILNDKNKATNDIGSNNLRKKKSKSNSRSKTKNKDTATAGKKTNSNISNNTRKIANDRKSNIITRANINNKKSLTPVKTNKKNNSTNLQVDHQNKKILINDKNININATQSPVNISNPSENNINLNKTTDIIDVDANLSSNINNNISPVKNSQNNLEKSDIKNNNNFLSNTSLTSVPPQGY
jgi:hypothetical protein